MKNIKYILLYLSIIVAMYATVNANSSTYYADLIADFHIINKQSTAEGYRLNDTLSRAELAKIATNLGGVSIEKCTGNLYTDVNSNLGDLCGYIEALAKSKIVSTSNKYFRPNDTITRAEAIKILIGVIGEQKSSVNAGYLDTTNLGDLEGYINKAKEIGSIANVKYIYPNSAILRHEVFVLASFYAGIDSSTPAFLSQENTNITPNIIESKKQSFDKNLLTRIWYDSNYLAYANEHLSEAEFVAKCDSIKEILIEYKAVPDYLYWTIKQSGNPCQESSIYKDNDKGMFKDGDNYTAFSCSIEYDEDGLKSIKTNGYMVTITDSENIACGKIWLKQEGY